MRHDAVAAAGLDLVVHPRRIRWVAVATAVAVVVVFTVVAVLLRGDGTGVSFRPADQGAMIVLGLLLAAGALLLARPRLRVTPDGVAVRNVLGERLFGWDLVRDVSFPDGASFARLELPDDEYVSVMAIQGRRRRPGRRGDPGGAWAAPAPPRRQRSRRAGGLA